jgi:phosphorylcholine metabolism protein LicD
MFRPHTAIISYRILSSRNSTHKYSNFITKFDTKHNITSFADGQLAAQQQEKHRAGNIT